jgi:hypothetical protein
MTKTLKHLEPVLGFVQASLLPINLCLVNLLKAVQDLCEGLGGVEEESPFTITDEELGDGVTAMDLPLAGPEPTQEGFPVMVRAGALRPGSALKQARPAWAEARTEMGDHTGVLRTLPRVLFPLDQKLFDVALDLLAGRARPALDFWRVETPVQLHQPPPVAFEVLIASGKWLRERDHGQQLLQEWVSPFCRLRVSEVSQRWRSSNPRRPPSAKGGLLAAVKVLRINSAEVCHTSPHGSSGLNCACRVRPAASKGPRMACFRAFLQARSALAMGVAASRRQ